MAYSLLASQSTVHVLSPTESMDAVRATVVSPGHTAIAASIVPETIWGTAAGADQLNQYAFGIDWLLDHTAAIAATGTQSIDANGLLQHNVTFTVAYTPPGLTTGPLTVQVDVPNELLAKTQENASLSWKAIPLRPGRYKLNVAVKDVNGDRKGVWSRSIIVPEYSDDKLSNSSLIVADQMEPVPTKAIGTGNFVIGTMKVRPRVAPADGKPAVFKRDRDAKLNFWMQVYNLGMDEKTHKPSATIEYDVTNVATNKSIVQQVESTDTMGNVGDQLTLQKSIASANLQPGIYRIQIKINDKISKQTVDPSAVFAVE